MQHLKTTISREMKRSLVLGPTLLSVATCGLILLILAACGVGEEKIRLATIDKTGSSEGSDVPCTNNLVAWARGAYGGADGERGELRMSTFNIDTAAAPQFNVRVDFKVDPAESSSPRRVDDAINGALDQLDRKVGKELATTPSGGTTDLITMFSGLGEAAHAVDAVDLYVCSDGFDRRLQDDPTPEHARNVLAGLDRGALPNLRGTRIVFDTTSRTGRNGLDADAVAAIRIFVEGLVKLSGGTIVSYGTGAGTL